MIEYNSELTIGEEITTRWIRPIDLKFNMNKKVLLRERKRHTDRAVSSTPSVSRSGVPPPAGVPPGQVWWGVPEVGSPLGWT